MININAIFFADLYADVRNRVVGAFVFPEKCNQYCLILGCEKHGDGHNAWLLVIIGRDRLHGWRERTSV